MEKAQLIKEYVEFLNAWKEEYKILSKKIRDCKNSRKIFIIDKSAVITDDEVLRSYPKAHAENFEMFRTHLKRKIKIKNPLYTEYLNLYALGIEASDMMSKRMSRKETFKENLMGVLS